MEELLKVGVAAIAGIGIIASLYVRWRNNFSVASRDFRNALIPELTALESKGELPSPIDDYLRATLPKHRQAAAMFEPHVLWWRRACFRRAWNQYHSGNDRIHDWLGLTGEESYFAEYIGVEFTEGGSAKSARALAAKRLRAVLSYASA